MALAPEPVGLVLAGGGARGAYEAAVLAEILPALEQRGESPRVIVGTSVGAISCAFVAANAHAGADTVARVALERWRQVRSGSVMRSIVGQLPFTVARSLIPGVGNRSLADTAPLRATLDAWIDWEQLHENVVAGAVDAAAVVATHASTGRSVVFTDTSGALPDDGEKLRYAPARLTNDHIRASAAIPIVFPPVQIEAEDDGGAWYFDGGTRLNTPIKPAIDLGARRVVVIAMDSPAPPEDDGADASPPDFGDAALHLLEGALVDPLIEDVRTLAKWNVASLEGGDTTHEPIPYIFIAPERRNTIGELAMEVFDEHYSGLRGLRSPDLAALRQMLGGSGPSQGALMSLLFFEEHFVERLIELGRADAQRWLDAADGPDAPWHLGPLESRPGSGVPHDRWRAAHVR